MKYAITFSGMFAKHLHAQFIIGLSSGNINLTHVQMSPIFRSNCNDFEYFKLNKSLISDRWARVSTQRRRRGRPWTRGGGMRWTPREESLEGLGGDLCLTLGQRRLGK